VVLVLAALIGGCDKRSDTTSSSQEATPAVEPAIEKEITLDLGGGVMMEFGLVPAGSFIMGDAEGGPAEKPVHKVTITKPFYLGKYEVTQEQWGAVMGKNPSRLKGPKNPVTNVNWNDAQDFLSKLTEKLGNGAAKFHLPTEAQWEYACRAGTTTQYSFGDDAASLGDYAWSRENSDRITHPVGEKKPNAWGLYDMHGNVLEWCADWFGGDYYRRSPSTDPTGPASGSWRVVRGGAYYGTSPTNSRCSSRLAAPSGGGNIGFRVARTLTP